MKKIGILFSFTIAVVVVCGQGPSASPCCQYMDEISGVKVFESDSLDKIIARKIKERKIAENTPEDFPYVYFLNSTGTEYLKIYSSPGNGYGQFFETGKMSAMLPPSRNLGKLAFKNFYSNDNIRIGLSEAEIRKHIPLENFRNFVHKGIMYFVYEEGQYQGNNAASPASISFLKFQKGKLISYGFGYGFPLFNPVFPP